MFVGKISNACFTQMHKHAICDEIDSYLRFLCVSQITISKKLKIIFVFRRILWGVEKLKLLLNFSSNEMLPWCSG